MTYPPPKFGTSGSRQDTKPISVDICISSQRTESRKLRLLTSKGHFGGLPTELELEKKIFGWPSNIGRGKT